MKLYQLSRTQYLPISLEAAWQFFSSPNNLRLITPASLNFTITSDLPAKMYAGQLISYQVSPFLGIPVQWVTEITHVREPYYFVDEQRFGPYRMWHHQHIFTMTERGVEMQDLVHYVLPMGILGQLLHEVMIRKRLEEIFDFRYRILTERFGQSFLSSPIPQ